jgi:hypothetical protein
MLIHAASRPEKRPKHTVISGGGGGEWQLAAGHFVPAKMSPVIIHPRPDAEMNAWARAARCPSAIAWSIPVTVLGGAWPFRYELTTAPSGMTITETLPADWLTNGLQDYGVISWATPTVGSHSVSVTVTDQDGTQVTRSFTLECIDRENTTYFMFLDAASGSNSNDGSYSSPKQTIAGWYGANKVATTHGTKQIFYRAGTYSVAACPVFGGSSSQQVDMIVGKPHVHVGYPGEVAIMDINNQAYYDWENGSGDHCYQDLKWISPTVTENSVNKKAFMRMPTPSSTRGLWFRNWFVGDDLEGSNDSNSSCVMLTGSGNDNYFSFSQNIFDGCDAMDFMLNYDASDGVIEGNKVTNGYGGEAWGFFFKALTIERWSIRANEGIDGTITNPFWFMSQYTAPSTDVRNNIEVCWNRLQNSSSFTGAERAGAIALGGSDVAQEGHYTNFWSYRNNFKNPFIGIWGIGTGGPFEFERDVIEHSGTYTDGLALLGDTDVTITKTSLATGTSMVDDTTVLLNGGARTTYLGTHGCEVD